MQPWPKTRLDDEAKALSRERLDLLAQRAQAMMELAEMGVDDNEFVDEKFAEDIDRVNGITKTNFEE